MNRLDGVTDTAVPDPPTAAPDRARKTPILVVATDPKAGADVVDVLTRLGAPPARLIASRDVADTSLEGVRAVVAEMSVVPPPQLFQLLGTIAEKDAEVPVVVLTGTWEDTDPTELLRAGAFSVLSHPLHPALLEAQLDAALNTRSLFEEIQRLRRQLEGRDKLADVGRLATGVAHEMSGPLDGVMRFVNLSVDALPADATVRAHLIEAQRGLRRMADILHDLKQVSRSASISAETEDAERLAREAVRQVLSLERGRHIDTFFEFPAEGLLLPRGMFQVFGNLAKNAIDAMPTYGALEITAREDAEGVCIDVSDTGTGIPDPIRDRVFEPFFTTKEAGGTGLGLSICRRIIEDLGGGLTISSTPGAGTTVEIRLPPSRGAGPTNGGVA